MGVAVKAVTTDRCTLEYFSFGTGAKPLVILPGVSLHSVMSSASAIASAYARFADDYTVTVFDCRSEVPAGFDVRAMAEDTAAAMKMLGITGASVFGCSHGGMLAQCLAIWHPALVSRMVLASTLSRQNETSRAVFDRWYAMAVGGELTALNRSFAELLYSPAYYERYRDVFAMLENVGTSEELRHFAAMIDSCRHFDVYEELRRITCPTLVIGALGDRVLTADSSVEMAQKIGCPLYLYDGFGHAVYDEADDYKDRLYRFFNE